jgi:hypothetical protein
MSSFGFTTPMATPPRGDARLRPAPPAKTIPFDYVFQFALQGTRGNKVQDVVEISSEGVFVALSVGYSLMPNEQRTEPTFEPDIKQFVLPQTPVMVPFFSENSPDDLTGVRIIGVPGAEVVVLNLNGSVDPNSPEKLPISVDSGIIRPDGTFTIDFQPPIETDRIIRVWDKTNELLGQVFVVGAPSTPVIGPNPTTGKLPAVGDTSVHVYGWPGMSGATSVTVSLLKNADGTIVEVTKDLIKDTESFPGKTTGRVEVELKIVIVEGSEPVPVPLAPGDLLYVRIPEAADGPVLEAASAESIGPEAASPESIGPEAASAESIASDPRIPFSMFIVPLRRERVVSELTLAELEAGLAAKSGADLTRGFRLNPNAANLLEADLSLNQVFDGTRGRIFELGTGCVPAAEEVSFLYSFDVGDTGREHQNRPIHNIAGLGIANGDRPSRPLAKPMVFEPRSFIRLQIEEISGPAGTLFIVLQGYKILGTGRIPG